MKKHNTLEKLRMNKLPQENNAIDIKIIPEPTCAYSFSIAALFWLNALKEKRKKSISIYSKTLQIQ